MKSNRPLHIILVLLGLVCGCATKRPSRPAPVSRNHFREMRIGLCEDYPKDSRSLAAARHDLELLSTNNIHVMRISFSWLDMEPERKKYDWSFWDHFVRMAADEYHIRLIPYVCYTPRWASTVTNETFWQQPPKDNGEFAEFISQLVARYRGRIHSWEIWNEPDNAYYWRGSAQQFAALVQAGAKAVRQTDPSANVVMGGLAWNPEFLESILANAAAMSNVDVINLHNYYETWASEPLERIPDYVGRAADLLCQYHGHQSIWMAEVGYSDFRKGNFVSGQYSAYFQDEHTESLFRVLTLTLASGCVDLIAWYRIHDLPPAQGVIGDENNRHLGIVDNRNRAKAALSALRFFNSLFPRGSRCLDNEVWVRKIVGAPIEVHAFQKPGGSVVIAVWLKTYVPGQRAAGAAVADQRSSSIDLELPFALKRGKILDELGNPRGNATVICYGNDCRIRCPVKDETVTVLQVQ